MHRISSGCGPFSGRPSGSTDAPRRSWHAGQLANTPPESSMPRCVALYARVSTRDKDQDPELQLGPLREYVAARGWKATEYVDRAPAGDLAHRTSWRRLLADAASRRIDLVLVWKLDRAFRSTLDALSTLQDLEHRGVGFASITQPELDTTSPTCRSARLYDPFRGRGDGAVPDRRPGEGRHAARGRQGHEDRPAQGDGAPSIRPFVAGGPVPGARRQALSTPSSQRVEDRDGDPQADPRR